LRKFASLFSGGGGVDIGASAGYSLCWGIEYDSDIARVANDNLGEHIKISDILKCNPSDFERVDWLHASPPCPSFSVAKNGGEETEQDIALSRKTLQFIQVLKPRHFTLENVWGYRDSRSWKLIFDGLRELGYGVDFWHINAADYGVPQTRKRMIVVANRTGTRPQKPLPTHRKKTESDNQLSMFEMLPNWISWYEAIEDLIPDLPDSQFAPWQIPRLPDEIKERFKAILLPVNGENSTYFGDDEPSQSLTSGNTVGKYKAFIVDGKANGNQQKSRMAVDGRVVAMTARCLARWQTFPEWYEFPDAKTLACKIIGNAVPCLLAQRIGENLK
jgi:DNA (cytosine-5)-methyltransferase 1